MREIDALDRALAAKGEDVVLRRQLGNSAHPIFSDVVCRAKVSSYRLRDTEEIRNAPQSAQAELLVTISPTQIKSAQWPGGSDAGQPAADPSIPRKGDKLKIGGLFRTIEVVEVKSIGNDPVRFDMRVLG